MREPFITKAAFILRLKDPKDFLIKKNKNTTWMSQKMLFVLHKGKQQTEKLFETSFNSWTFLTAHFPTGDSNLTVV